METENGDSKSKMEDYAVIEQIGTGAFGAAFLVVHKTENKKCVLKKIHLSKQTEKFKREAYQEMDLIAKLRHPYLLEYKDAWVDKGSCICIVTDYFEGGNISDIIRKARGAYFSEEKLCKWLTQMLLAIDYLHSKRVLHRDLKLSNIFVTKGNDICLGDFGLAKLLNEEGVASSVAGTPNYMCPELLADMPYGYKSDIWSLACCLFEIAAHQQAFRAPDMAGLINKINRSLISPMPIVYSSTLKQIIKSMLRKSPEHRPTAAELLRHPHLQPFLLHCQNLSTVFLPVKSPSPNHTKEKSRKPSLGSSSVGKDSRDRETKLKHRDLLPLFDGNNDTQYPNLLQDRPETKRVDPTSYSGKISHDSEEESINTMDAMISPSNQMSEEQEECSYKNNVIELGSTERDREKTVQEEPGTVCGEDVVSFLDNNAPFTKDDARTEEVEENNVSCCGAPGDDKTEEAEKCDEKDVKQTDKEEIQESSGNLRQQRADALESLLELCARLLKQDKYDELARVLRPFGEEAVSSRETAIWLTKSLINAQNVAKES